MFWGGGVWGRSENHSKEDNAKRGCIQTMLEKERSPGSGVSCTTCSMGDFLKDLITLL